MMPDGPERRRPSGFSEAERQSLVGREKSIVLRELSFLTSGGLFPLGILTTGDCRVVTGLYPQILAGMRQVYEQVEPPQIPEAPEYFVERYLLQQFEAGHPVSDQDVDRLREDLQAGKYSRQLDLVRRSLGEEQGSKMVVDMDLSPSKAAQEGGLSSGQYLPDPTGDAIIDNKRQIMMHVQAMREDLKTLYGEVNIQTALLTELLLDAPFLSDLISNKLLDEQAFRRHSAYLQEAIDFVQSIRAEQRIKAFEDATQEFAVSWVATFPPMAITPFDKNYLAKIYAVAQRMLGGEVNLDELHNLLRETVLRRGRVFKAVTKKDNHLELVPAEPESLSWEDIGGYQENTRFLQIMLKKTANKDPLIGDLNIILLAGKPGTGKSLAVSAFLNNLPGNARGIFVDRQDTQRTYVGIVGLAKLHPKLEIFVVIEDIDRGALTGTLLNIDSADPDALPVNVHLIATTNKPEVIDPAVKRPGRTSEILVYESPDEESRREIVRIHIQRYGLDLDESVVTMMISMTDGFTPDEIRHTVYSMKLVDITKPTEEDIGRFVEKMKLRRGAVDTSEDRAQFGIQDLLFGARKA